MRVKSGHGVCVLGEGDATMFIALYVDDLPMGWKRREVLEIVKRSLRERFEMHDLGMSSFLLVIELRRHGGGRSLASAAKACFRGSVDIRHGGQQGSLLVSNNSSQGVIWGRRGAHKPKRRELPWRVFRTGRWRGARCTWQSALGLIWPWEYLHSARIRGWCIGKHLRGCFGVLKVVLGMGYFIARVRMWSYGGTAMPAMAAIQSPRGGDLGLL